MSGLTPEQIDSFAMAVCHWWESGELAAFPESVTHLTADDSIPCSACRAEAEGLAPVVAALIAEAVEEARGEDAKAVRALAYELIQPGRGMGTTFVSGVRAGAFEAGQQFKALGARIARGEVSP